MNAVNGRVLKISREILITFLCNSFVRNMEHELVTDVKDFERRIGKLISVIRKRACFQSILELLNRDKPKLEMHQLGKIMGNTEKNNLIINKGKSNAESYYILQDDVDDTLEDSNENQDGDDSLKNLTEFADKKL